MPSVLAFCGFSKSGKTTLLGQVVEILSAQGLRVGVVKHHGHAQAEEALKDTDRHLKAGAIRVVLTGPGQGAIYWPQAGDPSPLVVAAELKDVDIVLAEGFKTWPGFKIEVFGPGSRPELLADPWLIGLAGPASQAPEDGPTFFDRDQPEAVARLVADCFYPQGRLGPVPDRETCFGLMARFSMKPNILLHSLVVTEVACRLACALVRAGQRLDLPLVEAGALLHDIAKTECLHQRCDHAQRGAEILASLGYPGLARVVAEHIDPQKAIQGSGLVSASAVVNYADKRVLHEKVVSLDDRGRDLIARYGTTPQRADWMAEMVARSQRLEEELFNLVSIRPGELEAINLLFTGQD